MTTQNLLVELFVEELPPKSLKKLGEAFAETLINSLQTQGFLEGVQPTFTVLTSPRRLSVLLQNVLVRTSDQSVEMKLMPASVGLDAGGKITPALLKKATALGITLDADALSAALIKRMEGKAETLFIKTTVAGSMLSDGLQKALLETLSKLPIAKTMSYQLADGWNSVSFVRPAHSLIALHGADIVPINVLGLQAGRITQGHRFEASQPTLEIRDADSYESQLENEGAVIASFEKRRAEIARQLAAVAAKEGLQPIQDEALLDEVTGLVERPNVLLGQFETEFLDVPPECLILTMKANQKYFPLIDAQGKLTNKFLIVSNIRPADSSHVIKGNERVVRARLADAKFFFEQDRKKTLASRVAESYRVTYHNELGSQSDRIQRVRAIAKIIAQQLGNEIFVTQVDQATDLAKADLTTDMVGEFPELQGVMGRYYAQAEGISDDIAYAIEDHYKPRFAGDELPRNRVGVCVALADKLETLVGIFSIGGAPTGDKDPFALRRQALGVVRLLIEKELPLELPSLIEKISYIFLDNSIYAESDKRMTKMEIERMRRQNPGGQVTFGHGRLTRIIPVEVVSSIQDFIYERLVGNLREQGYSANEVAAIFSLSPSRLNDVTKRLAAVRAFAALPEAGSLAAANKRVGNILKKVEGDFALRQAQGERIAVNATLLQETAEIALFDSLTKVAPAANAAFENQDYTASLQMLAVLKKPIDDFFDNVMVNTEDVALRENRLALLSQLHQAMNRVADLSKLAA